MIKEKQHLYFIAVIPPEDICEAVTHIKQDFASRFQSKHALKVVPHITLKSPFRLPDSVWHSLINWFETLEITVHPFLQELKDFGSFPKNRSPVIYIHPVANDSLKILHEQVMRQFRKTFSQFEPVTAEQNYKPHMTVAYRDLLPHEFKKAWSEYEHMRFKAIFEVSSFHLVQHINRKWESIYEYILKSN